MRRARGCHLHAESREHRSLCSAIFISGAFTSIGLWSSTFSQDRYAAALDMRASHAWLQRSASGQNAPMSSGSST